MRRAVALALWSTVAVAQAPNPPPAPKIAVLAVHADTGVSQGPCATNSWYAVTGSCHSIWFVDGLGDVCQGTR